MKRFCQSLSVTLLTLLVVGSAASAATIYSVMANELVDPTQWYMEGYGQNGYSLMWSSVGADGRTLEAGRPTGTYSGSWADNPAWLDFRAGTGGGGGPGGGTIPGANIQSYTLGATDTQARRFNFSTLFFDPDLDTGIGADELAARLTLTGSLGTTVGTTGGNMKELTGSQVRAGTMVTFDVMVGPDEKLTVVIESLDTFAAGFFLDSVQDVAVIPEPATLTLLGLGLAGMVLRRRK